LSAMAWFRQLPFSPITQITKIAAKSAVATQWSPEGAALAF
jgi:hypothetical protein